jgi:hypothetical protein
MARMMSVVKVPHTKAIDKMWRMWTREATTEGRKARRLQGSV